MSTTTQTKLYNLLKEAFLLLDFGDRVLFARYNLTAPRFYALVHLGDNAGITLKELSEKMFCDKSNATRIFKGLETEAYAERRRHESDGRSYRLFLTPSGKQVREQVITEHEAYNQSRLNYISHAEQSNLTDALIKLNEQLQLSLDEE